MLLTYASVALKDTLPAVLKSYVLKKKNDVVVFVRNLMDNVLYQDAYDALSEKVDKTLRVVSIFDCLIFVFIYISKMAGLCSPLLCDLCNTHAILEMYIKTNIRQSNMLIR